MASLTPISAIIRLTGSWGVVMNNETLERMQARARELARSGKFSGWRSVAFELQFEPGLKEVYQWLHSASVEDAFLWLHSPKSESSVDRLSCNEARTLFLCMVPKPPDVLRVWGRRSAWTGKSFCDSSSRETGCREGKAFIAEQQRLIVELSETTATILPRLCASWKRFERWTVLAMSARASSRPAI